MPMPACVIHRFIPGLRFEGSLAYQTCTQAGQTGWDCLPLEPEDPEDYAGQGVWWCARRCAAVLLRQPWRSMRLPPHLPARQPWGLDVDEVARVLQCLMPCWPVVCHAGAVDNPVTACAPALLDGGSALLLMQSQESGGRSPHRFWAWVMGLETRRDRAGGRGGCAPPWACWRDAGQADGPEQIQALLTLPFGWSMPWSCGYGARVQMNSQGLCDVGGICGQRHLARCLAAIALAPPAGPCGSAGDADLH